MNPEPEVGSCQKCGAEVSAFVTECPYCGARLRQRAPDLERRGGGLAPTGGDFDPPSEPPRLERHRRPRLKLSGASRPWASMASVAAGAAALLFLEASGEGPLAVGAIAGGTPPFEWWRYLAAPFVYDDLGYLFVCSCGILIFGSAIESRVGTLATATVIVASGSLGLLLGLEIEMALGAPSGEVAWGGNAIALGLLSAWALVRSIESRRDPGLDRIDLIGPAVCAGVLVLLSVVLEPANIMVGLVGALVGASLGFVLGLASGGDTAEIRPLS